MQKVLQHNKIATSKKYTVSFLIKQLALRNEQKISTEINLLLGDLNEKEIKCGYRKFRYLMEAKKVDTETIYMMSDKLRKGIADYFNVKPEELDS